MSSNDQVQRMLDNPNSQLNRKRDAAGGCRCPNCGSGASLTTDSRPNQYGIRRRRRCADCGSRWTTVEIAITEVAPGTELPQLQHVVERAMGALNDLTTALSALQRINAIRENL